MPFALNCRKCSHAWEASCARYDIFDQPCPSCGAVDVVLPHPTENVPIWDKTVVSGNRQFVGDRRNSLTEGWHPKEVGEVRTLLGDRAGACVQNDGSVQFADRDEQKHYSRRVADLTERLRHQAEREQVVRR